MSNSLATPSKRLDTQPVKEDMHKLMNEAVGLVQDQANRVEHDFLEPVYAWYQLNARMYPTTTVFLSVFSLLSLLPVATFIAFSTVVFASCITGAVTVALVAACSVCAIAGTILLFTLALTLGGAVCITSTYVTALLTYRLYFHLFDKEGRGLEAWLRESLARFGLTQSTETQPPSLKTRKSLPSGANDDPDADVTVEDGRTKDVKVEDNSSNDGWAAVDNNQVGELPEISKPFLNAAQFQERVASPGSQEQLMQ